MAVSIPGEPEFRETLAHLVGEARLSPRQAESILTQATEQATGARYTLRHLGAHLGIGAVFAFDVVPLPLGTIARVAWVAGARVLETLRGNLQRARVHSAGVLLIAAIPWFGYAAYLLPLRRHTPELAFLLANHSWVARTGRSYEKFLEAAPSPLARFGRWLVQHPHHD